jgi:lipopolysaccharide assembly outer membrane protein LptD (OstA)
LGAPLLSLRLARRTFAALCLAAAALAAGSAARAQEEPARASKSFRLGSRSFDLSAEHIAYEQEGELYVARGTVQIAQEGRVLTADWIGFSNVTRKGMALGHVIAREGEDVLHAEAMRFQLDAETGIVLGGQLAAESEAFTLEGAEIERLGDDRYRLRDARFTTCECPEGERDPWAVSSGRIDVEVGGYATARNSTIDVLGVPVLWLPWLGFPVKTERETGFLLPEVLTSSRTGVDVGLPFFWAASDALNVTLAPHYLTKRGFKPEATLEYVIGERSGGELFATFLWNDDEVEHNDPTDPGDDPSTPFSDDRWALDWVHEQELPAGWRAVVDGRVVSDNNFPFDFREFANYRNDRHLDALAFADNRLGARDQYLVTGEVRFADDLQNPDDVDRDEVLLQRAPDLRVSALPSGALGRRVFWSFDSRYTYFTAFQDPRALYPGAALGEHGLYLDSGIDGLPTGFERDGNGDPFDPDNPPADLDFSDDDFDPLTNSEGREGDGAFQEGELLADRGHRVVLNPRLHVPLRIADVVEVLPEVGWAGTFYQSERRGSEMRSLFTGQVDVRARLRRTLPLPFSEQRATHLLEPRFGYVGISAAGQSDNPLFVPRSEILQSRLRALEPTTLTRDPADRIDSVNATYVALGNRLYVASQEAGAPPRLLGDVTLSAWWDFAGDSVRNIFLDGAIFPAKKWRSRFDLGFDIDEAQLDETLLELGYADERGNDLAFGYRFLRDLPRFYEGFQYDESRFDEFSQNFDRIDQFDIYGRWTLLRGFAVTYRIQYSIEGTFSLRQQLGLEYVSRCKCWAIRLEAEDERSRGFEFGVSYRILGVGDDLVRPFATRRLNSRDSIIGAP